MSRIFHIATQSDWASALASGRYTTSTRGRTLAEEGFIHAARGDQWQGVRERYYADVSEPLVLLVIDTDLVDVPVVEEAVGGDTFPHLYGALAPRAVVSVLPLSAQAPTPQRPTPAPPPQRSFASFFLEEMTVRAALGVAVMAVAVLVGLLVAALIDDVAGLLTILVLLVLGGVLSLRHLRRRDARLARRADSTQ